MSVFRPIIKMCNIQYADETMLTLYFHRDIIWSLTDPLYLKLTITSGNWTWDESASTVKQITLAAGSGTYELIFKYGLSMPTASTKYSIAVTLEYYDDAGYTNLIETDNHTFEGHFYHSSDFATYKYDHLPLDNNLSSDNSLISAVANTPYGFETAIIEGTGSLYIEGSDVTISGIPASKFFIATYEPNSTFKKIQINSIQNKSYADGSVRKFNFYSLVSSTTVKMANAGTGAKTHIDGVYVFNEIP